MAPREKPRRPKQSTGQLMFNTHDPLEEIHRAERAQEDDYFRKLDQELIVALRAKSAAEIEQVIRQYTRMRCPKCGEPLTLQRHLTYGLPYMLLCEVVIAHFSRPPRGPIRAWESPPLTCRPLGHQSAALVPAWSWTRPGSAADGGLLR